MPVSVLQVYLVPQYIIHSDGGFRNFAFTQHLSRSMLAPGMVLTQQLWCRSERRMECRQVSDGAEVWWSPLPLWCCLSPATRCCSCSMVCYAAFTSMFNDSISVSLVAILDLIILIFLATWSRSIPSGSALPSWIGVASRGEGVRVAPPGCGA